MNICKVRFSLYQLLIFLIFLSYIFLDKEIAKKKKKKKNSTHGQFMTIFYFTQLVDRKQTTS